MVVGLEIFREYFKDYQDCYLVIGGTACDIILEEAGFTPRATDDIDLILIVEARSQDFYHKFWEFVKEAEYQIKQKEPERRNCYRFQNPLNKDYPKQIELFSRVPDLIEIDEEAHLTPIPTEEGLSNLSAILLDDEYYQYTIENSEIKDNIHLAKTQTIICLKAFAYMDNKKRKEEGQNIRTVDITKHKNDVFRMVMLLNQSEVFELPEQIKDDMQKFVTIVKDDLPEPSIFRNNGFGDQDMKVVFNQLLKSFNLTA